jgi:uncharacterized protein (DUF2249 family)
VGAQSLPRFKDMGLCWRKSFTVTAHTTIVDVRSVPLWRRLASILQAFDQLTPGDAMELIVDLDPWPLRSYVEATRAGACEWQALEDGPQSWRVRLTRMK